jgi:phosphoglycolate phosphatase-like HAD superfamily hydrolase
MKNYRIRLAGLIISICVIAQPYFAAAQNIKPADPLPSWSEGTVKRAIVDFVSRVTKPGGADFVPVEERIAVFDNDGTLWPENPVPFQLAFALDSLKQQFPANPAWKDDPFVKAALTGDAPKLLADHYKGLFHIIGLTHAGMTTDEFAARVNAWMKTAKHPRYGRPYDECIYQPMREVLAYLRANGFKTYIVSGGGADFMRVWSERVYGIFPQQVVGSYGRVKYETRDGKPVLVKTLDSIFVDDKEGKPEGIHQFIGRRPVMAFGNSDGDKAMLEYVTVGNPRPSFGVIVHHTDAEREFAYDANPKSSGKLIEALADAPNRGWLVVDMKSDWKVVLNDDSVTAVDVLLEPNATMIEHAEVVNARLIEAFPEGFLLDAKHRPHITLIQRFVRTADLEKVYAATEKVLAGFDLKSMKLQAVKHYYIPDGDNGVAGIVIETTPDLIKLQQELIDAVAPFTVETGTSSAFVTTPDDLIMNPFLIQYVSTFVPKSSGERFNPHVTTGVAPRKLLDEMLKEPFDSFTFAPSNAAVYQLGQYGTAAKKLKEFAVER